MPMSLLEILLVLGLFVSGFGKLFIPPPFLLPKWLLYVYPKSEWELVTTRLQVWRFEVMQLTGIQISNSSWVDY